MLSFICILQTRPFISGVISLKPMIALFLFKPVIVLFLALSLSACATQSGDTSLYRALGEKAGIENITARLIYEIGDDPVIRPYFEETDLDRFHEKLSEQICEVSGGPCEYSGDSMVDVHTKMNVSESDFNRLVDLLITAMNHYEIPHPVQNRLLARLAPMRKDIIYK